jgi:hypothetical protein
MRAAIKNRQNPSEIVEKVKAFFCPQWVAREVPGLALIRRCSVVAAIQTPVRGSWQFHPLGGSGFRAPEVNKPKAIAPYARARSGKWRKE